MIAKYNNQYFCIDMSVKPVQIWAYAPVVSFEKKTTRRGTVYYDKFVDVSEIDEIFDPGFSVKWNNFWCGANPSRDGNSVSLLVGWDSGPFAREHGFYEIERDRGMVVAWGLDIDIDECDEFRMTIEQEYPIKDYREEILSKEEWLEMYQKMERELSPSYFTNKE